MKVASPISTGGYGADFERDAVRVEFRPEDESVPIKPEHKMSKVQINKEMNAKGFKLVREYDGLPWQHLMFFGKAEKGDGVTVPASTTPAAK